MNKAFEDALSFIQQTASHLIHPQTPPTPTPLGTNHVPTRLPESDANIAGKYQRGEISQQEADRLLNLTTPPAASVAATKVSNLQPPVQPIAPPPPLPIRQPVGVQNTQAPAYVSPIPGFVPAGNTRPNISPEYVNIINKAAQQYGVNPALIAAHIQHESAGTWNPSIPGPTGDYGLAQIVLASHPEVTMQQALDPNFAIPFLAKYLATNLKNFGDINRAIASYNVGTGGASIQGPTIAGTGPRGQKYINWVSNNLSPELRKQLGIKRSKSSLDTELNLPEGS